MGKGVLIAAFDFSTAHADEFHDWYDLEHLPERKAVPGFGACERWIGDEQPTLSVATYDLDSIDVLRGKAYAAIAYANLSVWSKRVTAMCKRLLRFEGTQITPGDAAAPEGAGAMLLNAMNVAPEAEDDFNAWYDQEHLPALARVPGTLAARRYRSTEAAAGTHRYVAIYHLKSPDVARSTAWAAAVDTPWSARVRPHFRDRIRVLTRHYVRAG
jgi:heme-degrading monooxygenase HmoA